MITYSEAGATRDAVLPPGYHHVRRDVVIGSGRACFERATAALMSWEMHRLAGLSGGTAAVAEGMDVRLRGPLGLRIPCRVIYVVNEQSEQGFAYGTLPGHPERGEEAFLVSQAATGVVRFRITAFSRPAWLLARLAGPVARAAQSYTTDRYVNAMRRLA